MVDCSSQSCFQEKSPESILNKLPITTHMDTVPALIMISPLSTVAQSDGAAKLFKRQRNNLIDPSGLIDRIYPDLAPQGGEQSRKGVPIFRHLHLDPRYIQI